VRTSRRRHRMLIASFMLLGMFGNYTAAQEASQETESQMLARRLAELEAQVARLSQAAPSQELPGGVEPVEYHTLPPSPAPFLEAEFGAVMPPPLMPSAAAASPKYPTVQMNGFFQADALYFDQDADSRAVNGDIQDGAGFRRFRLSAKGAVAPNVNYFAQLDFGFFGRPTFTDVWGEVTKVPILGNVRFGQWKQPYSLEVVSSVRYQTFLERSVLFQPFDAFRHIGIGFYDVNEDQSMTWAMSVFRQGQDQFGNDIGDSGGAASAGRITWLPYYGPREQGLSYLHLGAAYHFGDPANNRVRLLSIPEAFIGAFGTSAGIPIGSTAFLLPNVVNGTPPFVDTGFINTHMFTNLGTELLWVEGPASFQAEAQMSSISQRGGSQLNFWGFYMFGSYFLTGESRPYDRKAGALDRVVPLRPFIKEPGCETGPGAWEAALRWSFIDLNDNNINGGQLNDMTAGVNWYLNGYTKVQFNFIHAFQRRYEQPHASTDIYGVRAQVDW